MRERYFLARAVLLSGLLLVPAAPAAAQRPPVRHYTLADGLPHNGVTALHQDRKGYLWIGTVEGLSRFDGQRFVTFATDDGLGHSYITDIAEDRGGRLWIATNGGGIARLLDESPAETWIKPGAGPSLPRKRFVSYRIDKTPESNAVNALFFDAAGRLWCATDSGIYRSRGDADDPDFENVGYRGTTVTNGLADSHDRLWFWLLRGGLIEITPQGAVRHHGVPAASRRGSIVEDRHGQISVASDDGLFELVGSSSGQDGDVWRRIAPELERGQGAHSMLRDSSGVLWVSTTAGLLRQEGDRHRLYSAAHGLSRDLNHTLFEDRDGTIWVGSSASGLYQLAGDAIVSYTVADAQPMANIASVVVSRNGHVFARLENSSAVEIADDRVAALNSSSRLRQMWTGRRVFVTREGDWWILGPDRVCRVGRRGLSIEGDPECITTASPTVRSSTTMDIPDLYEDAAGRIGFATSDGIYRLTGDPHQRVQLERVAGTLGPDAVGVVPMFEDRGGTLWLASYSQMGRLIDGRVVYFKPAAGLPRIDPRSVLLDRRGRLWIGMRYGGVSMTEAPEAARPTFVNYSTREGLSSNTIWSIAEDDAGRVYFGTGRGLDRLDPSTGRIRHFTSADGLTGDVVNQCIRDSRGYIWIATSTGLSRLDPRAEKPERSPVPTYITRVQVAGDEMALPEGGTTRTPRLTVPSDRNNLVIEFVGLALSEPHALRYQYKLDGVDADWSQPSDHRSVNYARLSPGSYRFSVRTISREGVATPEPATIAFDILPPFWQRGWFIATIIAGLGGIALALHQMRVRRLLATERLRRQIATDLHDDIGAGLSQVAMLSEVLKRDVARPGAERLSEIAGLARSMRDSMSDIVWAIDPRRDRLSDLVARMRQTALNSLPMEGVRVEFRAPEDAAMARIALAPDRRRHLLLILKEAVTNIARHAEASRVDIDLTIEGRDLTLTIRDDGRGFDLDQASDGHGLSNLRRRTAELGGLMGIVSSPGGGSTIELRVRTG